MSSTERIILGGSLILNAVLLIGLIFLLINRPINAGPEDDSIAQVNTSATTQPADLPTQTPIIITVVSTPTTSPVVEIEEPAPTETAVPTATNAPTETPEPTLEPTPTTEPSPTPQPTPTEAVLTGPDWLKYVNLFREQGNLPLVVEDSRLTEGAVNHSYYMVTNSSSSHSEDPNRPGYTEAGQIAGQNGNIAVSGVAGTTYNWPIEFWISAAFHTIPMLDPALERVGYGEHHDVASSFGMAATLDTKSGLRQDTTDIQYPVIFPRDGGKTWVTTYSMPEFPNTASSCTGYQKPTGAPIILMFGNGENTPQIRETRLLEDGNSIAHCVIDETNYYNPEAFWQKTGRTILDQRDAVIILPRSPLKVGKEYSVYVDNGGDILEWSFNVVDNPLLAAQEAEE